MSDAKADQEAMDMDRFVLASVELLIVYVSGFALIVGIFGSLGQFPYAASWAVWSGFYCYIFSTITLAFLWVLNNILRSKSAVIPAAMQCVSEATTSAFLALLLCCLSLVYESYFSDTVSKAVFGDGSSSSSISGATGAAAFGCTIGFFLVATLVSAYAALVTGPTDGIRYAFLSPEGLLITAVTIGFLMDRVRECNAAHVVLYATSLLTTAFSAAAGRTGWVFSSKDGWATYAEVVILYLLRLAALGALCIAALFSKSAASYVIILVLTLLGLSIITTSIAKENLPSKQTVKEDSEYKGYMPVPQSRDLAPEIRHDTLVWRMPSRRGHKKNT